MHHPLIALDFAHQETSEDAKLAWRLMFSPHSWKGHRATDKVAAHYSQSTYISPKNVPHNTSLFFSGRSALKALLTALQLPSGSSVAVQGFTCAAVTLPILSCGLNIRYVDINEDDFSMRLNHLESLYNPCIKVLILQHSFGIVPKYRGEIIAFCSKHNIFLIEDLAHGYMPNTLIAPDLGDRYCALVSFGRSKLFSSVFGAGVITPSIQLHDLLQKASSNLPQAPKRLIVRCLLYKGIAPFIKLWYHRGGRIFHRLLLWMQLFPPEITRIEKDGQYDASYAYAYPEVLAHTLHLQLSKKETLLTQITAAIGEYRKHVPQISRFPSPPLNRLPLLAPHSERRTHILRHFRLQNIFLGTWYKEPVGPERLDLAAMQYEKGSCPTSENVGTRIINLPLNVSQKTAEHIGLEIQLLLLTP
ncbi:MAG TPA: DegT/DnrJ/EryC1/StrS family aminotransferase [Candidatus Woesebacteria bacterium]|nr:DegT/DnrJ/EryC1/StrS family aminotransferase [Candidatus Woesebacteria bacterium]HNS94944.1 DegT/DnrJ/EryC1/StrS family aminotransferase [Candidatus Woesebacteria bacterium]